MLEVVVKYIWIGPDNIFNREQIRNDLPVEENLICAPLPFNAGDLN